MAQALGYKARSIRCASFNGRQVKIFKLWEGRPDAFYYAGEFSAPVNTPDDELVGVALAILEPDAYPAEA